MSIPLISLTYRRPDYLVKSLDSIIETASEPLEITVVDSLSDRSPENKEILKEYLAAGKIKRFVMCKVNGKGFSFPWAFSRFMNDEPFCILTDLDVAVPSGADWLSELKESMKTNLLSCFALDMSNYINTPNSGHIDSPDGLSYWLMGVERDFYKASTRIAAYSKDHLLVNFARSLGSVKRLDSIRVKHLAWDLWKDDTHGYWADKVKGINWFDTIPKDSDFEVYE